MASLTGRGVRIAVVDSGVHASHPHVGGVAGGIAIDEDGNVHDDYVDRLGHGTAVTAAIREKAPHAELYAVRVFDRTLSTSIAKIVKGIEWAARSGMDVVNLSLGTARPEHEEALRAAVSVAASHGTLLVAACTMGSGQPSLPGSLPGVIPVIVDWTCPRDTFRVTTSSGRDVCAASGYPREIPGVPRERNLSGVSFAVANLTGFVARALEDRRSRSASDVVGWLRTRST